MTAQNLQQNIPYLFSTPSVRDARYGLLSSYLLLPLSVIWIVAGSFFDRGLYYTLPIILLLFHWYVTLKKAKNLLFIFRYSLIAVIGLGAAIAWSFEQEIMIAPFGAHFQTHEATVALVGSVLLAVTGSSIAWYSNFHVRRVRQIAPQQKISFPTLSLIRLISLIFSALVVVVFIYRSGGVVSATHRYASGSNDLGFHFGAFNAFFFFFTAAFLLASRFGRANIKATLVIVMVLYALPILTGSRADFLMQMAIFAFVGKSFLFENQDCRETRYPIFLFLMGAAALFFLSNFIGLWRNVGHFGQAAELFISSFSLFTERSAGMVLSLSTGNQMAGHFYAVFAKVHVYAEPYLWGSSYFDFLLRTPPGFLGLERPEDLAWQMDVKGEIMAQGGIFEVAEAYWNFWYVGAFFIPFLITCIMAWFLKKSYLSKRNWFFFATSYVTLMLMSPRGIWYQTFAYWRVLTVLASIYLVVWFLRVINMKAKL
jgi:hypothetical protein